MTDGGVCKKLEYSGFDAATDSVMSFMVSGCGTSGVVPGQSASPTVTPAP